ncbi:MULTISPECIES: pilus assembly protein TadG-related protein [unclassified Janthinobacterium]|uniref:pilus assembly protein TadG-related protein n=1 Tax=unclassified Janthinobacterium TaxID=2610881 RepID=UPI0018DDFE35|nr:MULTISPECIES: pilus assembly protein TadG-related protein [unclassified Janthinobacterium]MDN2711252.1 pilus assembly protein TadG-related protein [Janthinobacterium sp. SUN118]
MANRRRRQRGAMLIAFSILLIVVLGFIGLALDVGQVIGRKTELQNLADNAALAAAAELEGTPAGLANAVTKAKASAAEKNMYRRRMQGVVLSDASIRFASAVDAPDGEWHAAGAVPDPGAALFVRIDTQANVPPLGHVATAFLGAWSPALRTLDTGARAVAGRTSLRVAPLAICALSASAAANRTNVALQPLVEVLEFGFRRGVAYNLFKLNPHGPAAEHFVLNPLGQPGLVGPSAQVSEAAVQPFVCTGSVLYPRIGSARMHVHRPFPAALWPAFNARFNQYAGGGCHPVTAPPDTNIRAYPNTAANWWMTNAPDAPSALSGGNPLLSVADPETSVPLPTAASYGPLWSFGRAWGYNAERPADGHFALATSNWAALYPAASAAPAAKSSYPADKSPYLTPAFQTAPTVNTGVALRRLLHIALLACPVPAGSDVLAQVRGIGRFYMTAPASNGMLSAEFAGLAPEGTLAGPVELLR